MQRVAVEYLKPSNRTVGLFVPTAKPDRAEIPPSPDVAAILKDYKGEAAVAQGEAFDPVARQHRVADDPDEAAERPPDRAAAEEDARRDGRRRG